MSTKFYLRRREDLGPKLVSKWFPLSSWPSLEAAVARITRIPDQHKTEGVEYAVFHQNQIVHSFSNANTTR